MANFFLFPHLRTAEGTPHSSFVEIVSYLAFQMSRYACATTLVCLLIMVLHVKVSLSRGPQTILVGIHQKASKADINATSNFHLVDPENGTEETLAGNHRYEAVKKENGIFFNGKTYRAKIVLIPIGSRGMIKVNNRRYRGSMIMVCNDDRTLTLINQISIEDYLRGILKREISPAWPVEALKAQAVISRTFALKNLDRHREQGFNVCSNVHCQVYGGVESEDSRIDRVVKETEGLVVTYNGELAQTVFFSSCGGKTENAQNIWDWPAVPRYLKGVRCTFCTKAPRYRWKEDISVEHLQKTLASYKVGKPITSVQIITKFPSGRARQILVVYDGGSQMFKGNAFRMAVSPNLVRSTLITSIEKSEKGFVFQGRGWGHGVGFCQWGAKGMAEKGHSFKDIIRFYYPGTGLSQQ